MTDTGMTTIERAFQLAREGACRSVGDIREQLLAEHYDGVFAHLSGMGIKRQLVTILAARGIAGAAEGDDQVDAE